MRSLSQIHRCFNWIPRDTWQLIIVDHSRSYSRMGSRIWSHDLGGFHLGFWNVRQDLRCRIKQLCLQKAPATEQPFRLSCWILFRNLVALPDPSSARSCLTCTVFLYNQWYKLKQHLQRCQVIFSIHGSFTCWVLLEGNDAEHDSFRPMVKEATLHRTLPAFCEHLLLVIWWFFAPHRPSSTSCKREKSEHLGPSSLVMWSLIFQSLPRISLNSNHLSNQSAIVCFLNSLPLRSAMVEFLTSCSVNVCRWFLGEPFLGS